MKTSSCLLALALAWSFSPSSARSGDNGTTTSLPTLGTISGSSGSFRLDNGTTLTTGTYEETFLNSTHTIVYTDAATGATSTDSTETTYNTAGPLQNFSRTVVYTHRNFGATASYTATTTFPYATTKTITPDGSDETVGPGSYGKGTFTAADGTTGTLTTFVKGGVTSTDLNNATLGLTRVLSVTEAHGSHLTGSEFSPNSTVTELSTGMFTVTGTGKLTFTLTYASRRVTETTDTVGPDGVVTTVTLTRKVDKHQH